MTEDEKIEVTAQILEILAKHKCSLSEAESIGFIVKVKFSESAKLCEENFREELREQAYRRQPRVPPHSHQSCR